MYPSSHSLAEVLIDERVRHAERERAVSAVEESERAPRWWRVVGRAHAPARRRARSAAVPRTTG